MRAFLDNKQRQWVLSINVAALKRVKGLVGVDLLGLMNDRCKGLFELVGKDVVTFCDILYLLLKDQLDKAGVTDEDFGAGLAGDALANAVEAFIGELVDFFPKPQREALSKALGKMKRLEERLIARATKEMDKVSVEEIDLDKIISESVTSLPGS